MIFSTHNLHPEVTTRLAALDEYRVASRPEAAAFLAEGLSAQIVIVRAPIPPDYLRQAQHLRAAVRHGAGLDMIPVDLATELGVLVANVPGVNASTVAEHVIMTALALRRRFRAMDHALRSSGWAAARAFSDDNRELRRARLGIVGYGAIGRELAQIALAMGMKVATTTRRQVTDRMITQLGLDDLLARSDVVVLACPLTPATRGLIGARELALMPDGTSLINVARGPVVVETALLAEVTSGRISAALDVFDTQPLPKDHPLFALENVILTPHQAGITAESMLRMGLGAAEETARILAGDMPRNFCNPEAEAHYRKRYRVQTQSDIAPGSANGKKLP